MPLRRYTWTVVLVLIATSAYAERLPLRIYTTADGLAHNEINRIVRDSRGFLWFCTRDGLSRFDGYAFSNFGIEQGLPSAAVNDLLETRAGVYWVATARGLVLFDPGGTPLSHVVYATDSPHVRPMFTVVIPNSDEPRARAVNRLLEDRAGTLWCATERGLQRLEREHGMMSLRSVDFGTPDRWPEQHDVYDFLQARDGTLWVATARGIYHRRLDGTGRRYVFGSYTEDTLSVFEDRRGDLWAATRLAGFFRFKLDEEDDRLVIGPRYAIDQGFPANWISGLFERSDGSMVVATTAGLCEFLDPPASPGARYRLFTPKNGLSYPGITALAEDSAGNLWVGSGEAGAMKLVRGGFLTYDAADGVQEAKSLAEDATNALCLRGTVPSLDASPGQKPLVGEDRLRARRYARFDGRTFDWFVPATMTRESDLGWVNETIVTRSRTGEWWFGTGAGVLRFAAVPNCADVRTARPIARYGLESGLAALQVFRLFEDSRGGMWVSTTAPGTSGLVRWDRATNSWWDVARAIGLPHVQNDLARSFAEDTSGAIWIGFGDHVVRYRRGRFEPFAEKDGLPAGAVAAMDVDTAGHLWFASSAHGLIRVDEPESDRPRFASYTMAQGLSSDSAVLLTDDLLGRVYVGTGRGLDRVDPASGTVKHFTTTDGLAPGQFRAAFRDHAGVLWFGTTGGLSRLVPAPDPPVVPPSVLFTRLTVAGTDRPVSALGEPDISLDDLKPAENSLAIEYVGLEFGAGETVQYSYKIDGAPRAEWSAPTPLRSLTLGNLAPGSYRLSVRAIDSQSAPGRPAVVSFRILRPIWQRWWFATLVIAAIATVAMFFHRSRVIRHTELANVRARIAMDLHDDIGANLTRISILSELARQTATADGPPGAMADIARIARESVSSMGDIVWAINPQRERLGDLIGRMRLHAEETCASQALALSFQPPADSGALKLTVDIRRDVFLIFKEALNNVVRHGRCHRVDISMRVEGGSLVLTVVDDGVGFDPSGPSEGQGLSSMRRRAESRNGTWSVLSTPGRGTTVSVTVPLASRRPYANV
jgi:signal transduction histidine kinase/ligand-binding sensor domain-containing protein